MSKREINKHELYPVFGLNDGEFTFGVPQLMEVPDELIVRYEASLEEFEAVQQELRLIYAAHYGIKPGNV